MSDRGVAPNKKSGRSRLQRVKKVAYATFLNFALTHWSNGKAVLPAVQTCKEAISDEIARKSPHRGFAPF